MLDSVLEKSVDSKQYNKLVRDIIPEFLISIGHRPSSHKVDGDELQERLREKAMEEFNEFYEDSSCEELADLEEVFECIVYFNNL